MGQYIRLPVNGTVQGEAPPCGTFDSGDFRVTLVEAHGQRAIKAAPDRALT